MLESSAGLRNGVGMCRARFSSLPRALGGMRGFRQVAVLPATTGIRFPRRHSSRFLRTTAGVSQVEDSPMETSSYVDNRVAVTIITGFLGAGKVRSPPKLTN